MKTVAPRKIPARRIGQRSMKQLAPAEEAPEVFELQLFPPISVRPDSLFLAIFMAIVDYAARERALDQLVAEAQDQGYGYERPADQDDRDRYR